MRQRQSRSLTRTMLSWRGACLIFFILGISWLATSAQTPNTKSSSNPEVIVTEKDNGRNVAIAKGGVIVVRLEVTSGTGYSWFPSAPPALAKRDVPRQLEQLGKSSMEKPKDSRPGATEIQVFRFKAVSAGPATLEFYYARPWEKNTPPAKTFQVQITVQ
jgi:inhibitor of cysteine peptidase